MRIRIKSACIILILIAAIMADAVISHAIAVSAEDEENKHKTGIYKSEDGNWYYYRDGERDLSYTGFASNDNGKWYVTDGKVTFKEEGAIKDESGALGDTGAWYYVTGSKVQGDFTGLSDFSCAGGWFYFTDGKADFTHNGVEENKNGTWYVEGGVVRFDFTGFAPCESDGGWWYIKDGMADTATDTVAKHDNEWWVVSSGKADFGYTGLAANENGVWYCENGVAQLNANGTKKESGITYKADNGKVTVTASEIVTGGADDARAEANEYICRVPANVMHRFTEDGGTITFVDTYSWTGYENDKAAGMAAGCRIELRNGAYGTGITTPHEIGHFIDGYAAINRGNKKYSESDAFKGITSSEIKEYRDAFSDKQMDSELLYGASTTEYFADAFAMYCLYPEELKESCPKTYNFMLWVIKRM